MEHKFSIHEAYKKQGSLTRLNILAEIPNFLALCYCYFSTRAVLVLVDIIDTGSNLLRNVFVFCISKFLRKDQRFRYNYGIGKLEAMAGMACDLLILLSLLITLGVSVHDIVYPQKPSSRIWVVLCLKAVNLSCDIFMFVKQRVIHRTSNSAIIRSTMRVARKNMYFDSISLFGLILMAAFGSRQWIAYVSPAFSIVLGLYLLFSTVKHIPPAVRTLLDKAAGENAQMEIMKSLASVYDRFDLLSDVRTHVVGNRTVVDLELGFDPQTSYAQIRQVADDIAAQLSEKIGNCSVSLTISSRGSTETSVTG